MRVVINSLGGIEADFAPGEIQDAAALLQATGWQLPTPAPPLPQPHFQARTAEPEYEPQPMRSAVQSAGLNYAEPEPRIPLEFDYQSTAIPVVVIADDEDFAPAEVEEVEEVAQGFPSASTSAPAPYPPGWFEAVAQQHQQLALAPADLSTSTTSTDISPFVDCCHSAKQEKITLHSASNSRSSNQQQKQRNQFDVCLGWIDSPVGLLSGVGLIGLIFLVRLMQVGVLPNPLGGVSKPPDAVQTPTQTPAAASTPARSPNASGTASPAPTPTPTPTPSPSPSVPAMPSTSRLPVPALPVPQGRQ